MIEHLQLSSSGAHASLVLFSHKAFLKIKFSDFYNGEGFNRAVDELPLLNSITRIDRALQVALNEMFSRVNGMRRNVPHVLVLLTDGKQTPGNDVMPLPKAVKPFHDAGIKVIVVGIGGGVNRRELKGLVKSPVNLKFVKNFNQLRSASFVEKITAAACKTPGKLCSVVLA